MVLLLQESLQYEIMTIVSTKKGTINMGDLIVYIILAIIGYFISSKLVKHPEKLTFIGPVQTCAIGALVVSMGARMGANEEVIKNLNKIGLYAFLMTIVIIAFSITAVSIVRRAMKLDRYGHPTTAGGLKSEDVAQEEAASGGGSMTLFIVITVTIGMISGYFVVQHGVMDFGLFDTIAGNIIRLGLCVLLFLVGLDLGRENTFIDDVKQAGLKILLIPAATCIGTLLGGALCSVFVPIKLTEALAVASGLGWYSLAPVMIMDKGLITVSAISFMHNVFRELIALLFMPVVAKKIGYIEVCGMPGSGAGDVCLPFIVKSTRSGIILYAFVTGITLSLCVPVLVPLFI